MLPFLVNSASLEEEKYLQKGYINRHFKWPGQDTKAILKGWALDLNQVNQTSYDEALQNLNSINDYHQEMLQTSVNNLRNMGSE